MVPEKIRQLLPKSMGEQDTIGRSGAEVRCFDDCVLKVQDHLALGRREAGMMRYLHGRLPVPQVLAEEEADGVHYLLMTKLPGKMLCNASFLTRPDVIARRMGDALEMLWSIDWTDCPYRQTLDDTFRQAEENIRAGRVRCDMARQPETYGKDGFASPEELLDYLKRNRPEETLVLSHGDFCLPNILADENGVTGLIDLGAGGVSDRWVDIEMGLWSFWFNTEGGASGTRYPFDRDMLFQALHLPRDEERIRYFSLLSELYL